MQPVVVGITGASGAIYAVRLVEILAKFNRPVELCITPTAAYVFKQELGVTLDLSAFRADSVPVWKPYSDLIHYNPWNDFSQPIASGSFLTSGMVICPCTGGSMGAIAAGFNQHLIHRAAEVHLKERRKLILVFRETPLSLIHLENMTRLTRAGAVVLPACPAFYSHQRAFSEISDANAMPLPKASELVDFVIARIGDQLGLETHLTPRWNGDLYTS